MAACRQCQSELAAADRFCSSCGLSTDQQAVDSGNGFELLDTTTASSASSDGRLATPDRRRLFAVVGLGLAGLVLFTLLQSPDPDPDDPQNAQLQSEDDVANGNETEESELDKWTTTTEDDQAVTTRRSTTSTVPVRAEVSFIGDGTPLLGEETGLYLFVGGDSSKLRRIDLDTGEVVEYLERLFPSYATGQYLIGSNPQNGNAKVMLIDDPTVDTGLSLNSGYYYPGSESMKEGPEPGQLWVISDDFPNPSWNLIRLSDGEVLQEIELATQVFYGPTVVGPTIAGSPSGGVFELQGDTFVQVGDGSPKAVSDQYVLTEDCVSPVECQLYWLERGSWATIDRPLPEERPDWSRLSADGRVLMYYGLTGAEVFDVERGESVPGLGGDLEGLAVSPGGRYVFAATGSLRILDLDTQEFHRLEGLSMGGWGSGLFVEKP